MGNLDYRQVQRDLDELFDLKYDDSSREVLAKRIFLAEDPAFATVMEVCRNSEGITSANEIAKALTAHLKKAGFIYYHGGDRLCSYTVDSLEFQVNVMAGVLFSYFHRLRLNGANGNGHRGAKK